MTPLLLAALLTCAELASPEIDALAGKDTRITLALDQTSLDRVFKALGEQAGFRPTFLGYTPIVSVAFEDITLARVLEDLAARYALRIRGTAPDRLEVRAPAAVGVGGVSAPKGKERKRPDPVPGLRGKVVLHAVICEDGTVSAISEASGTDEPRLVQSAMDAVRQWTYEPALKDDKPVAVSLTVILTFGPD